MYLILHPRALPLAAVAPEKRSGEQQRELTHLLAAVALRNEVESDNGRGHIFLLPSPPRNEGERGGGVRGLAPRLLK
jgi:hypothetical protein